jgi:hypothetical protein
VSERGRSEAGLGVVVPKCRHLSLSVLIPYGGAAVALRVRAPSITGITAASPKAPVSRLVS